MARYKIILAYDGTHFEGFQRQGSRRTVQAVIETALVQLGWQGRAALSAGRTDSGVHAAGQVVAFDLNWAHPVEDLGRAINAHLPEDVAIQSVSEAAADFHPRFDATSRCYRYRIYCTEMRDPLRDRFAWRVWPAPEADLLVEASAVLPGEHDFSAFGTPPKKGGCTIRVLLKSSWEMAGDELVYEVEANAFLYRMVRRLVFTQVAVGLRRLTVAEFRDGVLATHPLPPGLAQPQGLVLDNVKYDGVRQGQVRSNKNLVACGDDNCGQDIRPER